MDEILRESPIFRGFSEKQLENLQYLVSTRSLKPGEYLFKEGHKECSLYIIKSGAVKLAKVAGDGGEKHLATLEAGDILGEMSYILRSTRSCDCKAIGETDLWELREDMLESVRETDAGFWSLVIFNISRILCQRVQRINYETMGLLDTLAQAASKEEVDQKVAKGRKTLAEILGM